MKNSLNMYQVGNVIKGQTGELFTVVKNGDGYSLVNLTNNRLEDDERKTKFASLEELAREFYHNSDRLLANARLVEE